MSSPSIRPATTIDAALIAAIHAGAFPAPWPMSDFTVLLQSLGVSGWIIGADEPAGFIMMRAVADEAEILTLAIHPSHRRQGLAANLINHAIASVGGVGAKQIFLEVAADNVAALKLYERAGFKPCGRRPDYYRSGSDKPRIDAVVMRLEIPNSAG